VLRERNSTTGTRLAEVTGRVVFIGQVDFGRYSHGQSPNELNAGVLGARGIKFAAVLPGVPVAESRAAFPVISSCPNWDYPGNLRV